MGSMDDYLSDNYFAGCLLCISWAMDFSIWFYSWLSKKPWSNIQLLRASGKSYWRETAYCSLYLQCFKLVDYDFELFSLLFYTSIVVLWVYGILFKEQNYALIFLVLFICYTWLGAFGGIFHFLIHWHGGASILCV